MTSYELTDYDYFRFGQQLIAVQSMAAVTDEPFFVEATDSHDRFWAMGMDSDQEIFITHDKTNLMFPVDTSIDFRVYKTIRDAANIYEGPQKETFGAKFNNYVD